MSLTSLVVAAKATHTATVVWVHGLGKEKRMLVLLHMLIIVYKAIVVQVGHSWLMSFLISSHMWNGFFQMRKWTEVGIYYYY
jgi:predicted esterase